jgi:DNA adenine methylase
MYNVPYGKENPHLPSLLQLLLVSRNLANATIIHGDFAQCIDRARSGDLLYFDPPYPPLNGTSYFQHYTVNRFSSMHQSNLAALARDLSNNGCLVLISNADTSRIRGLYKGWRMNTVELARNVSCKAKRMSVGELIIRNY